MKAARVSIMERSAHVHGIESNGNAMQRGDMKVCIQRWLASSYEHGFV